MSRRCVRCRLSAGLAAEVESLVAASAALDLSGLRWIAAVQAVNREVRRLGLPYFVDANAIERGPQAEVRRTFYLTTYAVEDIRRFEVDGRPYGALEVSRLDDLNLAGDRLGYVRDDEPFALVLLDVIEEAVARREELLAEGGCGGSDAFLDGWKSQRRCHAILQARRPADARAMVVEQTTLHELQHLVDGPDLPIPRDLFRLVPAADDRSLGRAAAELSAWVCQLRTEDDASAAWTLAHLAAFVLTDEIWQTPERYAAGLIFGTLLGQPVLEPMGALVPDRMPAAWEAIAAHAQGLAAWTSPLADAAHEAWFGAPCARPVELP